MKKILIIAPHPDDEVLGCGGTIARLSKRDKVFLAIATKAYTPEWSEDFISKRSEEIKKANKILGISKTFLMDLPTVKLDLIGQKQINDKLSKIIKQVKPDIVFIPYRGDLNRDHRILFESALVACRPHQTSIKKILSYEVLSETEWGEPLTHFSPQVYIDISKTFNQKIKAMETYSSEIKKYPHPRSIEAIEILARKRGTESGLKMAEAFSVIRETI